MGKSKGKWDDDDYEKKQHRPRKTDKRQPWGTVEEEYSDIPLDAWGTVPGINSKKGSK